MTPPLVLRAFAIGVCFCHSCICAAPVMAHGGLERDSAQLAQPTGLLPISTKLSSDAWGAEAPDPRLQPLSLEKALSESPDPIGLVAYQQQAGSSGGDGGGGGGAGAAAATDPSKPLAQFQVQNVFVPDSYDATGYSNQLILQPVIPLNISEDAFFPYHIVRPTLPIIAPTPDPDGPAGVQGGLGDMAILDVLVHPVEELKTSVAFGYAATLPTSTHPALGRGEWELGPAVGVISQAIPKWNIGFLYEQPFSLESDAYSVLLQPVVVRTLPKESYVGWGDLLMKLDDQNGGYDLPISVRAGKVVKFGGTPINIFLQPSYTPEGLRSSPGGSTVVDQTQREHAVPRSGSQGADPESFGRLAL